MCRISREAFATFLHDRASPAVWMERDPGEYWQAIRSYNCDPLFILAMFWHESQAGNKGMARITRSFGNTRPPSYGVEHDHIETAANGGQFSAYGSWLDGCVSTVARLMSEHHVYAGRQAIGEIFDHPSGIVWAPAGDNNDPAGYLNAVLAFMNEHSDQETFTMPDLEYPGHVAGTFATQPKGVILHGSRSGKEWSLWEEFLSTARWAANASNPYGWNATIGEDVYSVHIPATHYGVNAGTLESSQYLAVEFAQATVHQAITDKQVAAFVDWYREAVLPHWPGLKLGSDASLPAHAELPQGIAAGKSDVFPRQDGRLHQLRDRIRVALNAPPVEEDPNDAALERLWRLERQRLGEKQFAATLARPDWGGEKVLVCQRGVLSATGGQARDISGHVVDDFVTYAEADGSLTRL